MSWFPGPQGDLRSLRGVTVENANLTPLLCPATCLRQSPRPLCGARVLAVPPTALHTTAGSPVSLRMSNGFAVPAPVLGSQGAARSREEGEDMSAMLTALSGGGGSVPGLRGHSEHSAG